MDDPTHDAPAAGPREPATRTPDLRTRLVRRVRARARAVRSWRPRHGWGALVGLLLGALLASVVFGVTTASTVSALGPHVTRYDVTTDATVTADFGPLGTLQIDSPLPLTLGVRATVQEIPASVTELGEARTLQALADDLQAYVAFFSGPAAAVQDVAVGLATDAALRTLLAFVALVAVWLLARVLLGEARRGELVGALATRARPVTAGALALVLGATVLTSSVAPGDRPTVAHLSSSVFDGTPLAGARVTGRLGGVLDTYGAYAVDAYRQNEEFYATADDALTVAWQQWESEALWRGGTQAPPDDDDAGGPLVGGMRVDAPDGATGEDDAADGGTEGDATTDGTTGDGTTGDGDPGSTAAADDPDAPGTPAARRTATPAPTATPTPSPTPAPEPIVLVVVSDLHCNVGMAPLIGTLARLSGADAVLDAGDTTMNGTSVEQYCVTSFARAVPDGVPLVTSPGNHDSRDTSGKYARAGATVLDGSVIEVAGLRVLGDNDPNETRVGGGGTGAAATETAAEMGERLAQVACDDGDVDLLLIHTPTVGDAALDEGCVPAQVSGHYHRRVGPDQIGQGIRYISSSTAGATLNQPTVGPLRGVAELTVLRVDPDTRRVVSYQVVQVTPDATVTVNRPQRWPAVEVPRDVDDVAPGDRAGDEPGAGEDDPDGTAPDPAGPTPDEGAAGG